MQAKKRVPRSKFRSQLSAFSLRLSTSIHPPSFRLRGSPKRRSRLAEASGVARVGATAAILRRLHFTFYILPFILCLLSSCSFSRPPARAGSKGPPSYLLKFVPYSKNNALMGYFSLGDAATNQVAAAGQLRIQIYTFTTLTMGNSPSAVRWKKIVYDNTFAIGVSNFHWESYGNFFTVKDLACHFMVPYEHFQTPVRRGRVVTAQIDFRADGGTNNISSQQNVSLY